MAPGSFKDPWDLNELLWMAGILREELVAGSIRLTRAIAGHRRASQELRTGLHIGEKPDRASWATADLALIELERATADYRVGFDELRQVEATIGTLT